MGAVLCCLLVGGALVLLGGWLVGQTLWGGGCPLVADAAAEVQNLVNSLGVLPRAAPPIA